MNQAVDNKEGSISLRVNQSALIKNLKFSFSNSFTVLTELLQNARRAGATCVHLVWDEEKSLLSVTDDGDGISDFQKLLTVAESGWDQEVVENDSPFGMGFLSCMFAAEKVVVHSNGRFIEFETSDALDFNSTQVRNSDRSLGVGTIVELHGGDIAKQMVNFPKLRGLGSHSKTIDFVQLLVKGFPLPVFFNGEEVKRGFALDSADYAFFDTPVGKMAIPGLKKGRYSAHYIEGYLQGISVEYPSSLQESKLVVVHLDSKAFFGRMPDRDKLVNRGESMDRIVAAIDEVWRTHLKSELAALGEEAFLQLYVEATLVVCPELFGQMSVLPKDFVELVSDEAIISQCSYDDSPTSPVVAHIKREDIESGKVRLFTLDSPNEENLAAWIYAKQIGGRIVDSSKYSEWRKDHWAKPFIVDLDQAEAAVTVNDEIKTAHFSGNYVTCDLVLCSNYTINLTTESGDVLSVTVDNDSLYCPYDEDKKGGECFIVPAEHNGHHAIYQAHSYIGEFDDLDESSRSQDEDEFCQLVSLLRGNRSAAGIFEDRISTSNIFYVNELKQKTFITRMGDSSLPNSRANMAVEEFNDEFAAALATHLSQSGCNVNAEMVKAAMDACMTHPQPE